MTRPLQKLQRFFQELKRRNVYKVAIGYLVAAFVALQAADLLVPETTLPAGTETVIVYLTIAGFPIALVIAWAFEVTPEGVRRTAEAEPDEGGASEAGEGLSIAYKVLIGLGLVGAAVAGGWYLTGGGGESPEVTEGTVAVLPFEVTGSGTERWRDGMVSLLSTGLDGAAGLRAIPDRTVLAAWKAEGPGVAGATTEQALAVARQVGARYGVVGTAAGLGPELQFSASAYETTSGDRLGQVEVSGPPDSVSALAGELTRRVLGLLAAETGEELRAADLASVTTTSDSALRAFLAGERHRRGAGGSAVEYYEAAIRADSSFALPYARLGLMGFWHGQFRGQHMRRAYELSAQLPERERRLVRALYLGRVEHRTLAARDSLRRLTDEYPDDPWIWESLGELVFHTIIPRGLPEVETTHERAVELDPGDASIYPHYVGPAFTLHHDSALATKRLEAVPRKGGRRLLRLARDAIFGDSARRQQALSAYDTTSVPGPWLVLSTLSAPQDAGLFDTIFRRLVEPENGGRFQSLFINFLFRNDLLQGRIEQALSDARQWEIDEEVTACRLAWALTLGYPVPDSVAARQLAPETLPDEPSLDRFACAGLYLMGSSRSGELDSLIRRLRATVDTAGPDGVLPGRQQAVIQELRGYRAWKQGDLDRAARLWDRSNESSQPGAIWRGDLHRELGRLDEAEGWYLAAWSHPVAHERLGQLYEEMGKPEKAAAAYRRFIAAWEDADEELQPRVEKARERLQELTASGAEPDD